MMNPNPDNTPAQLLQSAQQALAAGDRPRARELLLHVVATDETNAAAWWALGQVVESPDEREICLENVLTLEPEHAAARQALAEIQVAPLPDSMFAPVEDAPPPHLTEDYRSPIQMDEAEVASAALFTDELMCPACAAVTVYEDRRCPACGQPLWERGRVVTQTRPAYGLTLTFEGVILLLGGLLAMVFIAYATLLVEPSDFGLALQFYLGRLDEAPPGYTDALVAAPAIFFWLPLVLSALALPISAAIATRWQPLFYVSATLAGARVLLGASLLLLLLLGELGNAAPEANAGMLTGVTLRYMRFGIGLGALLALVFSGMSLAFLLGIQDHFEITERRLLLQLDRNVEHTAASYWMHGQAHAQNGLWALAALHLRYALIKEERLEIYLQLAATYVNLDYLELAERTLADARRFSPHNPQIERMATLIAQKRAASATGENLSAD